jgi:folate-binding protein YgfZ
MTRPTPYTHPTALPFLGVLRLEGPDSGSFLQGQLTQDTRPLAEGRTLLAACCTPQGRVVAVLRLRQAGDSVLAVLPAGLVEPLAARLQRFVMRARVRLQIDSGLAVAWTGATDPAAMSAGAITLDYAPGRAVLVAPRDEVDSLAGHPPGPPSAPDAAAAWWAADIADGLPQVLPASSEAFVPQMLNLDLAGAISFTKGCYTGQEIVARTQNLGRIKRRMARLRMPEGEVPLPLSALTLEGAKVAEVVMGAPVDGGVEVLAVTSLEAWGRVLVSGDGRTAVPAPLPYEVSAA